MNMAEINKLDKATITKNISDLRVELFNLKFQKHTSGNLNAVALKTIKKNIARLKTALNQKGKSE